MNNPEELFEKIVKIVAHPHTTITKHDIERAAKILLEFNWYIGEHEQDQEDVNCPWVHIDENFMFYTYLKQKFGENYVDEIDNINI